MNQVLDANPSGKPMGQSMGRQGLGYELTNQRSVSSVLTKASEYDLHPQEIADAGLKVSNMLRCCFSCLRLQIAISDLLSMWHVVKCHRATPLSLHICSMLLVSRHGVCSPGLPCTMCRRDFQPLKFHASAHHIALTKACVKCSS